MSRRRVWRGESLPQNLNDLVDEGKLTLAEARRAADHSRVAKRQREQHEQERARELAEWQERQAEEKRMAKTWAEFIEAHMPAIGDHVLYDDWSIRFAVATVKEITGCDIGCGHKPITREQLAGWIAQAEAGELTEEQMAMVVVMCEPRRHRNGATPDGGP